MADVALYIQRLLQANPLREPALRACIKSLQLPIGSCGLDVGCGVGLQTLLLADAVGAAGHITGVDILAGLLEYGEDLVEKAGLSEQITLREGDMHRLPFDDDSVDWAWSADCIGYPAGELASTLAELVRVVRPGGSIVVLGWSSQQVLPGYPFLEARLNASCSSYLPFLGGEVPESHFLRALRSFRDAGLGEARAQTFVGDVQAPLGFDEREALLSLFEMLWGEQQPGVLPHDWEEYQRLCKPGSADLILGDDDYYAFFTYSMFRGRVGSKPGEHPAARSKTSH